MFGSRLSAAESGRETRRLIMKSLLLADITDAELTNDLNKAGTPFLACRYGYHAECTAFIAKNHGLRAAYLLVGEVVDKPIGAFCDWCSAAVSC